MIRVSPISPGTLFRLGCLRGLKVTTDAEDGDMATASIGAATTTWKTEAFSVFAAMHEVRDVKNGLSENETNGCDHNEQNQEHIRRKEDHDLEKLSKDKT